MKKFFKKLILIYVYVMLYIFDRKQLKDTNSTNLDKFYSYIESKKFNTNYYISSILGTIGCIGVLYMFCKIFF